MNETKAHTPLPSIPKVIAQLLERGAVAVVVTVMAGVSGVGLKLLVEETGDTIGSLGGPELDSLVARQAAQFLASREETRTFRLSEFAPQVPSGDKVLLLFERIHPAPRLVVCGAGHVGAALARLGSFVGYHVTLIDDRAEFVKRERFPEEQIEPVFTDDWSAAVRHAIGNGRGVAVAVVTRGHNEDEECMRAVVEESPDYVGLIGSKRRTTIVIDRLRESGADEQQLLRIRAPIGLDIGAVTPEEVALAIIAEIVGERRGGKGGSLSAWRRN
jgi:xanthine dehydrogenase accessory factor